MLKKIVLLGLTAALGLALAAPAFALGMQAAVGEVSATDGVALGQVGCRIYSLGVCPAGSTTGCNGSTLTLNANSAGPPNNCPDTRCLRTWTTLQNEAGPGGYAAQGENTTGYNADAENQTFYVLWDGQVNAGAGNHAAFYAAQGTVAASATPPLGAFRKAGCSGTTSGNCFYRDDTTNSDQTPVQFVNAGYQSAHTLSQIGGLSPVPTVRVGSPGVGCPNANESKLTWDDPALYTAAMNSNANNPPQPTPPPSPVLGVRLYSNNSPCSTNGGQGPGGDTGWTAGASFANGTGAAGTCVPVSGDTWYALTVRFRGPGAAPSELETGHSGGVNPASFVGANSQCVGNPATASRIVNLTARYAGRGSVNVTWTTGTEGGVQGFYVTRGTSASGPFSRVSEMVAPRGDGQTYAVQNKVHSALGRVQYYSIEVVNADGTSTQSGPAAVNLPAAKQRFGR